MRATGSCMIAAALACLAVLPGPQPVGAQSVSLTADAEVLATVDGDPVTARDLLVLLAQQPRPADPEALSSLSADGLLKRLIQNRLLEQEGYRLGIDETPSVKNQVEDAIRHRSMMALLDSVSSTVPEPEPVATVETAPRMSRMFRASHILLKTESEASALLDSLAAGAPFADLAKRHSLDTDWAQADGDLGWAREDKFIPEFGSVLATLSTGEVGGPVQTSNGWHLLQLTEVHTETMPQDGAMAEAARKAEKQDRVMKAVRAYVESLKDKYGVVPNDSLLATLDYAAEDPQVFKDLQANDAVLAKLPWRDLTVAQFTRQIRFEHFHGLTGKPDAPQMRDRTFNEWVTELLLRHEAIVLGFHKKPEVAASGEQLLRERLREEVGQMIMDIRFDPQAAEVERYYRENRARFAPPPRLRASGVILSDPEAARRFRQRLEAGSQLGWLAERTPEVTDPQPAMFAGWLTPEELGLPEPPRAPGQLVGPFETGSGWAVARVAEVEARPPLPLDQCRPQVLGLMKADKLRDTMTASLEKLEEQAEIQVTEGAVGRVQGHLQRWLDSAPRTPTGGPGMHGGMHGAGKEATP